MQIHAIPTPQKEQESTRPKLDEPGLEPVPLGPEPDRMSPSRTEREPYTLAGTGSGLTTGLSNWAPTEPEQDGCQWDNRSGGGAAEEAAGAESVEIGGQREVEVQGKEEAQLKRVELAQRDTLDLRPARELVTL
jgi:hypothetical protein